MGTVQQQLEWFHRSRPAAAAVVLGGLIVGGLFGCQAPGSVDPAVPSAAGKAGGLGPGPSVGDASEFLVVDCLLPARVKRLGSQLTYLGARRALRTSGVDCGIRGGEYVAYDRANYQTALAVWQAQAKEGDPKAQNYVGEIYERGLGTTPDYGAAAEWYQLAADQDYAPAQINLGQLYEQGLGVPKDEVVALNWYRRASGFDTAGLTYVVATDVAGELETLREEVVVQAGEADRLRNQILALQTQLGTLEQARPVVASRPAPDTAAEQAELERARAELAAERTALEEAQRQFAARQAADASAENAELERVRAELAAARAAVEEARQATPPQRAEDTSAERAELERGRAELAAEREALDRDNELARRAFEELDRRREALGAERRLLAAERAQLETKKAEAATDDAAVAEIEALLDDLRLRQLELTRQQEDLEGEQAARQAALTEREAAIASREVALDARAAEIEARAAEVAVRQSQIATEAATGRAEVEAREARVRELEAEVLAREAEIGGQQADVAAREARIREQEAAIAGREARIRELESEISAREGAIREREAAASARAVRLQEQESEVSARQAEVEARTEEQAAVDQQIAALREEVEARRRELEVLNQRAEVALAAPTITMLDPALPPTRGLAVVRTRAGLEGRPVVGRVYAPAGLLSLSLNEHPQDTNDQLVFRTTVPVPETGIEINLVAIDNQGKQGELSFALQPETDPRPLVAVAPAAGSPVASLPAIPPIDFGRFHALVIGNDDYPKLPGLDTAVTDANAVADLLSEKYGFQVTELRNATRYQILSALEQFRKTLTEDDNLLIYYAGHGELDQANDNGNWLPIDAEPDSRANWISNLDITNILNTMAARRVLVVADSCYSGSLTRAALAQLEPGMTQAERVAVIEALAKKTSRTALTSGGLAPTLDSGGGRNSVFARAFLDVLTENEGLIEGQQLHREVRERVTYIAEQFDFEQVPQYAPIKRSGHAGGEFFFVPKV